VDKSKQKKGTLKKQIQEEKETLAREDAHSKVLSDVVQDHKLTKVETKDKSQLPSKEELKAQIKADKQGQQREAAHTQLMDNISEGDYHLKHTDTVDRSLTKKSKKEQREAIKNEKDAYANQEYEDRSKVLGDVTKEKN